MQAFSTPRWILALIVLTCALCAPATNTYARTESDITSADKDNTTESLPTLGNASNKAVPRFGSIKSDQVNLRIGPGVRYPILWILRRDGMPVQILADYDTWRRIRTPEGDVGWVHKSGVSGARTAYVTREGVLYEDENAEKKPRAKLSVGLTGKIWRCSNTLCKVQFGAVKGYVSKDILWGDTKSSDSAEKERTLFEKPAIESGR